MQTLILLSLLLALLHIWLLPMILNAKNMEYLLSNRDGAVEESGMSGRVRRASTNFKESFPVFLALCLLSIIVEVDNIIPRLNAITDKNTEARIYIRGDRVVAYGRVMEIMSIINSAGYIKVALVAQNPTD